MSDQELKRTVRPWNCSSRSTKPSRSSARVSNAPEFDKIRHACQAPPECIAFPPRSFWGLGLFAGEPVAQPSCLLPYVGYVSEVSFFKSNHSVPPCFTDKLSYCRHSDIGGRRGEMLYARVFHQERTRERSAGTEGKQIIEGLGVVTLGVSGRTSPEPSVATSPGHG
jgi:hypothetical protein